MAAEKKESSVLFSLRELREIEEERITEEKDAKRRAEEDRIRTHQEAERRAREEEESRRRAAEDAERAAREAIEKREREERLRVEEAERRARVEAQAALEQQRMHKELEIRAIEASKKKPIWLIAIASVIVVGLFGFWAYNRNKQADADKAAQEARLAELQKQMETSQANIDRLIKEKDESTAKLLAARTAEEKAAAQQALDRKNAEIRAERERQQNIKDSIRRSHGGGGVKEDKDDKIKINCDPNDPLCGVK